MTIALQEVTNPPRRDAVALRYEVAGWLDADASDRMREIERDAAPDSIVEIDLRNCSGMDDFGFGSLVGLIRRAREQHARVRVRGANEKLGDELRRTGVARLVDLLPADRATGDRGGAERVSRP
ncbi:MAG TPA: STAS domain-containing protein [Acidimicrobiales bacterium]